MAIRSGRSVASVVAALAVGVGAAALEGDFTPETREKLSRPVTIEEEAILLAEFAEQLAEQTGLSFAASAHVTHMPDPVAVLARDVPAGELIEAVAFALHLEVRVTPGGVVAFRLEDDDPRREEILARMFPRHEGPGGGEPPRVGEEEVVERVAEDPKVRGLLEKLGGHLVPAKFIPEKRMWVFIVRREGEMGPPLAHVMATEDGEIVDMKVRGRDGGPGKGWKEKRLEKGRREKGRGGDEERGRFGEEEALEREGRENF